MGLSTERFNRELGISRERQDAFAAGSHEKAAAAAKDGRLGEEIVPVTVPQRRGDPIVVESDEGIRPGTTTDSLAKLRAGVRSGGHRDRRNASQISDGAARRDRHVRATAEELGISPLGNMVCYHRGRWTRRHCCHRPSQAIAKLLNRTGTGLGDIDLFEINEAFAAVVLASADDLGVPEQRLNVNGGAIALGHPVGMSGTRLALGSLLQLRRSGGSLAAVALCGGGGQGDAALLRSLS